MAYWYWTKKDDTKTIKASWSDFEYLKSENKILDLVLEIPNGQEEETVQEGNPTELEVGKKDSPFFKIYSVGEIQSSSERSQDVSCYRIPGIWLLEEDSSFMNQSNQLRQFVLIAKLPKDFSKDNKKLVSTLTENKTQDSTLKIPDSSKQASDKIQAIVRFTIESGRLMV